MRNCAGWAFRLQVHSGSQVASDDLTRYMEATNDGDGESGRNLSASKRRRGKGGGGPPPAQEFATDHFLDHPGQVIFHPFPPTAFRVSHHGQSTIRSSPMSFSLEPLRGSSADVTSDVMARAGGKRPRP